MAEFVAPPSWSHWVLHLSCFTPERYRPKAIPSKEIPVHEWMLKMKSIYLQNYYTCKKQFIFFFLYISKYVCSLTLYVTKQFVRWYSLNFLKKCHLTNEFK